MGQEIGSRLPFRPPQLVAAIQKNLKASNSKNGGAPFNFATSKDDQDHDDMTPIAFYCGYLICDD